MKTLKDLEQKIKLMQIELEKQKVELEKIKDKDKVITKLEKDYYDIKKEKTEMQESFFRFVLSMIVAITLLFGFYIVHIPPMFD